MTDPSLIVPQYSPGDEPQGPPSDPSEWVNPFGMPNSEGGGPQGPKFMLFVGSISVPEPLSGAAVGITIGSSLTFRVGLAWSLPYSSAQTGVAG
jgi:hypothetical protein